MKLEDKENRNKLNRCMYSQDKSKGKGHPHPNPKKSLYIQKEPMYLPKPTRTTKQDQEERHIERQLKSLLRSIQLHI